MQKDAIDLIEAIISGAWSFFTELHVPGFKKVTFAALFIAVLLATIGIKVVFGFLGISSGGGESSRTSSTNNPKISKERQGDTH